MKLAEIPGHHTEVLNIPAEEFAPGIWAGTEGMGIELRHIYKVVSVDLHTRTVKLAAYTEIHSIGNITIEMGY
jgi:hypothetical protein